MFRALLILNLAFLVLSCKKKEPTVSIPETHLNTELKPGLPLNPKSIHAYLYAVNISIRNSNNYGPIQYKSSTIYASFNDPAKNLMNGFDRNMSRFKFDGTPAGNIFTGEVKMNSISVQTNSSQVHVQYLRNNQVWLSNPARWSIEGNSAFTPIESTLGDFPQSKYTTRIFQLSMSRDTIIDFNKLFPDCDSLRIAFRSGTNILMQKSVPPTGKIITFKGGDAGAFTNYYGYMFCTIYASKYYNQIVNDKVYLYEQVFKLDVPMVWTQ